MSSSARDNSDPYAQTVVGHQVPHLSGLKHVTGEAVYVDDIPAYANEGHLALVLSTRAHAKLLSVDPSEALEMDGVLSYVDWRDMPSKKANCWGTAAQDEYFFAEDEVTCHGQIIGAVVAKTKLQAQRAARKVKVEYEDLPIILTIEEAVAAKSFFPSYDRRMSRGKPTSTALAESECTLSGTLRMGGQEHFYLETMGTLAIPKLESGEMEIIASTQDPTGTQRWVAQVTGVPRNRIVAKCKRMGGGFGGKESRTAMVRRLARSDTSAPASRRLISASSRPSTTPYSFPQFAPSLPRSCVVPSDACSSATKISRSRASGILSSSSGRSASPSRASSPLSTPTSMPTVATRSTSLEEVRSARTSVRDAKLS